MEANYKVAQSRLYLASRVIAESMKEYLPQFTELRPRYTLGWLNTFKLEITACENMPDEASRDLTHERVRREVMQLGNAGLTAWKSLKLYIYSTSDAPNAEYRAAGWSNYAPAANQNFEALKQLLIDGLSYINENEAALMADENMPATFREEFIGVKENFDTRLQAFYDALEQARITTEEKISLNNLLYKKLIMLCQDGQHIFETQDSIGRRFSFSAVCEMISPSGASEVEFIVTSAEDNKPLMGEVTQEGTDKSVTLNEQGRGLMTQLAGGEQIFKVFVDGFDEKTVSLRLTGTKKTEHVKMERIVVVMEKAAPQPPKGEMEGGSMQEAVAVAGEEGGSMQEAVAVAGEEGGSMQEAVAVAGEEGGSMQEAVGKEEESK